MKLFKYYKTIIIFILILLLSLTPTTKVKLKLINILHFDKIVHFSMYFTLTSVFLIDIKNNIKKTTRNKFLSVIIFVLFFSGIIEIIQSFFISGRNGSWFDLLANGIGILISVFLFFKTSIFAKFLRDY